jgi:cation diffusion facilitator family transporter
VDRLVHPRDVERIGAGLAVSVVAAIVNVAAAVVLLRGGRTHRSLALTADARHLLTDVWTSAGVVVGVALVGLTGWEPLDPIVALAVGANIVVTGVRLVWRAGNGLLDPPLPADELSAVHDVLATYEAAGIAFHALRTRTAGHRRFLSVHVLVPGDWSVRRGHELVEELEGALRAHVPGLHVFTHLEPVEDDVSYADQGLER